MSVLVTGGAGYIGSHTALALADRGEDVVVLDDLSTGDASFVPASALLIEGSVRDYELVCRVLKDHAVDSVLHFAGSIIVPESIEQPLKYYENNFVASCSLIQACVDSSVRRFIFSSTAAVYGEPAITPVKESAAPHPISPYGRSKLMVEWVLRDAARAHDLRYMALRYFNVAGIDPLGRTGQPNKQSTHLIKRAAQVALGQLDHLDIYGTDWPTRDGSAVRDYIHVSDLADAHLLALDSLRNNAPSAVCNCGYGRGTSVFEVVAAFEKATGRKLPARHVPRRPGDAAEVVADPSRIRAAYGWQPRIDSLDTIVQSALEWERQQSL